MSRTGPDRAAHPARKTLLGIALVCLAALAAAPSPSTAPADAESVREGPQALDPSEAGVGELVRLADLVLEDADGAPLKLSDARGRKATVFCMTRTTCPVAKKYAPVLADVEKQYRDRGVAFVMVNPSGSESPGGVKAALESLKSAGFAGRYARDRQGRLARALRATSSTEVFVLDAASTLVYRGAADDQFGLGYALPRPRRRYLVEALDAALEARRPLVRATTAPGCLLDLRDEPASADAAPPPATYHNRVSRILQNNCVECHRSGENGPFELKTYADVKDQLAMMKKVIGRGTMPPWFADPKVGHWANDRTLGAREKSDLLAWIEAGAPEGDPKDAPVERAFAEGWRVGNPDAVFEPAGPVNVPARGPIPYRYVTLKTNLTEDKWVRAVEVRTAAPQVTHHLLAFAIYPRTHPRAGEQPDYEAGLTGYFAALVPSQGATVYPHGTAKFLPKGATLVLQIHYTPDGTAVQDRPRVGVWFAEGPPEREVFTAAAFNNRFRIPPGAENHEVRGSHRFDAPVRLLSLMPHSHVRGKAFRYELQYPDGRTEVLLNVPRYDFNWQLEYHLRDPIDVPAGARLRVTGWYDNSPKNPANPDPTRTVRFGEQTSDEMMIGYFTAHAR